jgi:hypothetical protein
MLGDKLDPIAGLLIQRKVDGSERADSSPMPNEPADAANAMLCPACARSMTRVRTIWRAFQDDLQVFECRACNVSVSAKVPPRSK